MDNATKSDYLSSPLTINGTLREESSVINPSITFNIDNFDLQNYNYAYIKEFNRYYFIKDITYIIGNNLGERWSKILEYDFNKDENHQICYAMLSVLSENDIKFWNQNKEKFIHLPPYYFELMHKYFTQTRPSCQIVYSISNLTQADYYVTYSNKCAIYSDIINLYLSYLIEEASRPYLGYIFKSRFVNKYLKPLNKKLYETNELKTPLFFNSKNK